MLKKVWGKLFWNTSGKTTLLRSSFQQPYFIFAGFIPSLNPNLFCAEALRNVLNCRRLKLFFHIEAVKAFKSFAIKTFQLVVIIIVELPNIDGEGEFS